MHPWPDLKWWDSGERQAAEEKIDALTGTGIVCNPKPSLLYEALRVTSEPDVRVCIVGQDPYPAHDMATGVAFSIPADVSRDKFPHTLRIVLAEYQKDLGLPAPSNGDLLQWARNGVLLWNSIPSCQSGHSLSHDWPEWECLTSEIIHRLDERGGVVFVFLGAVAARHQEGIDVTRNRVIRTSHPSPRGSRTSKTPFTGSRLFSTANARLRELGRPVIDWRLGDDPTREGDVQIPIVGGGEVLPNITGVDLGGRRRQAISPNIYTSLLF